MYCDRKRSNISYLALDENEYKHKTLKKETMSLFYYGIYPVEGIGVFRVPKNGDARNKKPPALRVETKRCTKKSPFRYNRVVQALL